MQKPAGLELAEVVEGQEAAIQVLEEEVTQHSEADEEEDSGLLNPRMVRMVDSKRFVRTCPVLRNLEPG